jgi:hypothetical protein
VIFAGSRQVFNRFTEIAQMRFRAALSGRTDRNNPIKPLISALFYAPADTAPRRSTKKRYHFTKFCYRIIVVEQRRRLPGGSGPKKFIVSVIRNPDTWRFWKMQVMRPIRSC